LTGELNRFVILFQLSWCERGSLQPKNVT